MLKTIKMRIVNSKKIKLVCFILYFFTLSNNIYCQVEIDETFGINGQVLTDVNNASSEVSYSMFVQADDKIVVAGISNNKSILIRYNINGEIDETFGTNGMAINQFGSFSNILYMKKLSNGKIITAGVMRLNTSSHTSFIISRYNSNGILDTEFGDNGSTFINIGIADYTRSLDIQEDGKIIILGETNIVGSGTGYDIVLFRLLENGLIDNSFGENGIIITDLGGYEFPRKINIQADHKIVVLTDDEILRYESNGNLDQMFGQNGIKTINEIDNLETFLILENNKFIITSQNASIIRLNSNGTVDTNFGQNGVTINSSTYLIEYPTDIKIQKDNKIVISSYAAVYGWEYFGLTRFNENGSLDNEFGVNGFISYDFNHYDRCYAFDFQSDNKIVLAGRTSGASSYDIALVRYTNDVVLNNSEITLNNIMLYPNPSNGKIQIKNVEKISVITPNGKILFKKNTRKNIELINLTNLQSGIYFVILESNNKKIIKKIIIEKSF